MTTDFSKILDHPDKDEIISKLVTGINPKDVSDWLKLKYSKLEEKHLQVSSKLLKEFLDGHIDLYNDLKRDIVAVKNGQSPNRKISESLLNNKTYKERLNDFADKELDIKKQLSGLIIVCTDRIEQIFDKIQEDPTNYKPDYALIKWIESISKLLEQWNKYILNSPDQVIQHNITIQKVEEYSSILQSAVVETLEEIDQDLAFLFMEKLNSKLVGLKPEELKEVPLEKRIADAKIISNKISNMADK